jgi:hypothetical protein
MKEIATMPKPTTTILCLWQESGFALGTALPPAGSPCRTLSSTGMVIAVE